MIPKGSLHKTQVLRWEDGQFQTARLDPLAVEEPLEIRLCWGPPDQSQTQSVITTLRTPGADYELALGWLFSEGLIQQAADVVKMTYCLDQKRHEQQYNILQVRLKPGLSPNFSQLERRGYSHGGCGLCGKESIAQLHQQLQPVFAPDFPALAPTLLASLPERVKSQQPLFERSGAVHAAALFKTDGTLLSLQEDIGRHNAVDKLIGEQLQHPPVSLSHRILFLSGRAGFELIQKALRASIPVVVAIGAPSSLAVELARSYGQTLAGFLSPRHFNLYSGAERIQTRNPPSFR